LELLISHVWHTTSLLLWTMLLLSTKNLRLCYTHATNWLVIVRQISLQQTSWGVYKFGWGMKN
jgi:hypothetical protein